MENIMKDRNKDQQNNAIDACEAYLKEQKEYNISNKILPSENQIIERLLLRRLELSKLTDHFLASPPQIAQ